MRPIAIALCVGGLVGLLGCREASRPSTTATAGPGATPICAFAAAILRSAAAVEQTFGGITTRLWDDPFEWTLPEALSTNELILNYLNETEETRRKCFAFFASDEDLRREIPAP